MFLLDQRGCGLSTALQASHLEQFSPEDQLRLLSFFRADSIVEDCEFIRKKIIGTAKWTLLGQSYGGFVSMRYLSARPEGIDTALFAGGIPPVGRNAIDVYRATFCRLMIRNERYYERYPQDVQRVKDIIKILNAHPHFLPDGGIYTAKRFQLLGLRLGTDHSFEALHYLIEKRSGHKKVRAESQQPN